MELLSTGFEHTVAVDLFDGDSVDTRRSNILAKLRGAFAVGGSPIAPECARLSYGKLSVALHCAVVGLFASLHPHQHPCGGVFRVVERPTSSSLFTDWSV